MLDWSKLDNKSFERFCYDIASEFYKDKGNIDFEANLSRHLFDFYLKISEQEIWAWEIKFYINLKKISKNRIVDITRQIEKSLTNTNSNNVRKVILCIPTTLSLEAENWFYYNTVHNNFWRSKHVIVEIWNSNFLKL